MQNGIIIEIAVVNACAMPLPVVLQDDGIAFRGSIDHYWRIRFIESGEQVDATTEINSLRDMVQQAREFMRAGEAVAWRYYETGVSHSAEMPRC